MPTPPRAELELRVLTERIRDHGRETQLFLNSVLVSVAVANAAYVFALLLASPISQLLWLPFVLASFGFVLVTFAGGATTGLLIVSMPDWTDSVLLLLQAVTLFLMFSTLVPMGSAQPLLIDWYAVVGAHALIGALMIWSLAIRIRATSYDASLHAVVHSHLKLMRRSATAAAVSGIFWFAVWISIRWLLIPDHSPLLRFQGVLGAIAFAISMGVVAGIERDRRMFVRLVPGDRAAGTDARVDI